LVLNNENDTLQEKSFFVYNHESDPTIERQAVSNSIKQKMSESIINEIPSKIMRKEFRSIGNDTQLLINNISFGCRHLCNKILNITHHFPRIYNEVHEVLINMNIMTDKNEHFLLINNKETNIIIFTCLINLKYSCSMENIFMDRTFQFCTKYFCQFFVLHGFQSGMYTSLVFALLSNKSTSTYEHFFNKICNVYLTVGFVLNPNMFVIYFNLF
jgi:hypothetical protein